MQSIIEVKNLKKSFKKDFFSKKKLVLKDLSFSISKGSVVGFLGANGSGKTTTFKCMLNLIKKDSGEILFFNSELSIKTKSLIGFLPERTQTYEDLTAVEYLLFLSQISKPFDKKNLLKKIHELLLKLDLDEVKHQKLKTFSKGMKQKVSFIQALLPDPEILILDEPFSGLDLDGRDQVISVIEELKSKGITILVSSHILQDLEKICDQFLVLKEGSVLDIPSGNSNLEEVYKTITGKKRIPT